MKVTVPVFRVPSGSTLPVFTVRVPIVPPGPEIVPLVAVVAAAILPVTFKVPLITLMLAPVVPESESADRVRIPVPSKLSTDDCPVMAIGFAMILAPWS